MPRLTDTEKKILQRSTQAALQESGLAAANPQLAGVDFARILAEALKQMGPILIQILVAALLDGNNQLED